MYGVLQGPITYDPNRVYYGNNQNITDPFLLQLYDYLKPVCDRSDILPDCLKNHNSSRFWNQQIEVKSTVDHKVVCASWEENGYAFSICAISAGEEQNEIDPSTIGKEATYMIEAFQ